MHRRERSEAIAGVGEDDLAREVAARSLRHRRVAPGDLDPDARDRKVRPRLARRVEQDEPAPGRMRCDLVFGAALAAQQPTQPVATLGNELGIGELDDLVADERGIAARKHPFVGEALQRAVVELHLDGVDAVPSPRRADGQLGDRLAHDGRQPGDSSDHVVQRIGGRLEQRRAPEATGADRTGRHIEARRRGIVAVDHNRHVEKFDPHRRDRLGHRWRQHAAAGRRGVEFRDAAVSGDTAQEHQPRLAVGDGREADAAPHSIDWDFHRIGRIKPDRPRRQTQVDSLAALPHLAQRPLPDRLGLLDGQHDRKAQRVDALGLPDLLADRHGRGLVVAACQSALDRDPVSASKRDPFERRVRPVALAPSELAGVAETGRARACA